MTFPHKALRELKPNWDSYGAPAIDERCIEKAFELWRQLSGEWQVVPCNDGGVQLEQHRGGFDIEIRVSSAEVETSVTPEPPEKTWECSICGRNNYVTESYCQQCDFSRMVMQQGRPVPRDGKR